MPSPADLPNPGIDLWFPPLQADSLPTELSLTYPRTNQHQCSNFVLPHATKALCGQRPPSLQTVIHSALSDLQAVW